MAHSIAGTNDGGYGVLYTSDKSSSQGECYSGSYFTAYKCAKLGASGHDGDSKRVDYHHMTMMDNGEGFGMVCGVLGGEEDGVTYETRFYDNKIFGELDLITDCPIDGSYCVPLEKKGIMLSGCNLSELRPMSTLDSMYP